MQVRAITWAGTRTDRSAAMVDFVERLLGLRRVQEQRGIVVFAAPNGDTVEVFTADEPEHLHFTTGPVVGFLVDDVEAARRELEEAGIELLGPLQQGGGMVWQHFRAPDGNVWEVTGRTNE